MPDFAVIETGGKQYKVSSGNKVLVEKLPDTARTAPVFDRVLLRSTGGRVEVGAPYVADVKVQAKLVRDVRGEKKIVFKYHSKTRARKKKGHRQDYAEVEIISI